MRSGTNVALAICGVIGAAGARAAPEAEAPPEIVVRGSGLARLAAEGAYDNVVIDRARLTGDASGRVEDVLSDVAGLQQFRRSDSRSANPSAQGLTLRALGGNASSRALVLLDGVPLADPFFGYIPFNMLSPDRLGEVRVTRGGGVGPFGVGALSGTVEMVSAGRADLPFASGSASYGSFDSTQLDATVAPNVGQGYVALSGRFERSDGFNTTPPSQRVAATVPARYRDWSTGLRSAAPIDAQTEVQANVTVYRDNRTLRFAGADSSTQANDASVRLIHRGDWAVDAVAYVQTRNFTNKVISSTSFRLSLDQRDTPATGAGGKVELRHPLGGGHLLRLGGDYRYSTGELFEDSYNANLATNPLTVRRNAGGNETTGGLFVENQWQAAPSVLLTGGGRLDRWTITDGFITERTAAGVLQTNNRYPDRHGTRATGRVGAKWTVSPLIAIRAAGYTGFRLPTLNELYRPFVVFPITTRANAALGLERLRGVDGGIDLTPAPWASFSATLFYNHLAGAISNATIDATTRQRQNVDAIVAKGIELSGAARQGAISLVGSYAHNISHVHSSGATGNLDGRVPAQSPRDFLSGTLAWAPKGGPSLSATLRRVSKQYEDDLMVDSLPAATTVDGVGTLPLGRRVTLVARLENMFDKTIVTRNAGGSMDYGTPRTFWLGVRFSS